MPTPRPEDSEWMTRKLLIDAALRSAGWKVVKSTAVGPGPCAIEEYPTAHGPADYALAMDGGIVALVEAKKLTLGPQNVLSQAQRYSKGVTPAQWGEYGVPFLYSTNGEVIWHQDVRDERNRSRQIQRFHTPDALREALARNTDGAFGSLLSLPNDGTRLRPYQRDANTEIEKALAARKRHMLVAMATGTGKTFTLVNEIYRLMKSGVARRVLFLVDRRALAAQAVRAFSSFDADAGMKFDQVYEVYSQRFQREDLDDKFDPKVLPRTHLTEPKLGSAFVYVSTIQRMTINLFGGEAVFGMGDERLDADADKIDGIPIHAFDLIVADECHRGYTSSEVAVWRKTLDHFDAVKIGLTATPAAHTTSYFKDVVFRYEYERAVREGFLVDYDVLALKSDVRLSGVFLAEGEEVGTIDPESGAKMLDVLEDERTFDTTAIERDITAPDSNKKILEELRTHALAHEERYGRFPKVLIFAANDLPHTSHADALVELARDVFGRGDSFVQKITGSPTVDRPLQRIREFRNRPQPSIVVTVDMLSTGVDIPDLEFIVFLRPVRSRILFEQMLGRGTRKGERYPDKSHFTVVDCFDGTLLEYFKATTGLTAEPPTPPTRTISEIIEAIWQNKDRDYNVRCLTKRLQRIDKEMSGDARTAFSAYLPAGDVAAFAKELSQRLGRAFGATMELLRNERFKDLLVNYERKPRVFYVAETVQDTVTSSWRVRGNDGKEYKPDDYLTAFTEFVRQHENDITAIAILLSRHQDWSPAALQELRDKLATAPPRFTVENLQRAHEATHHKALVDIISMVKHAANERSPLLSAAERVERTFSTMTTDKTFTKEQQAWLDRIREHLQENLSIDQEDFETQPVFTRHGGWGRANKAFNSTLPELLQELNRGIAA